MTSVRLTPGKADFVRRKRADGTIQDVCLLKWNIDFSQGCVAQVHPCHLDEVLANNGRYAPGNYDRYRADKTGDERCKYCYAWKKNSGGVASRTVDKRTRKDFETYKPEFVRFGKNSEPGHSFYFPEFMKAVDLCTEFDARPIITTKMLPFGIEGARETAKFSSIRSDYIARFAENKNMPSGKEIAEKLIEAKTSLLFSLGYDQIESGPRLQGFSNQWRIEQAKKYHSAGVNTSLTVVCDVTDSIEPNLARGSFIGKALEEKASIGINVRIIPARLVTEGTARVIAGAKRSVLTDPGYYKTHSLLGEEAIPRARYRWDGRLKAVADYLHPDFVKLTAVGLGMCGAASGTEMCDHCNCHGNMRIAFPESEIVDVVYSESSIGKILLKRMKKRKLKEELKTQIALDI